MIQLFNLRIDWFGQKNEKMKKLILITLVSVLVCAFEVPKGWIIAGSKPTSYNMGTAVGEGRDGKNCATIQSKEKIIEGFGTLMQVMSAEKYLGKRVRMTGYVKTQNVQNWCGLWMRCDGENKKQMLAFDNMENRRITGNTDWKNYFIVLDVPEATSSIAFGVLLGGTGKVWFDEIQFEIVPDSVPTTGRKFGGPQNLSFDE